MPEYRFYVFGPEDDYRRAEVLTCRDDDAAVFEAQRLLGGNDVEIWKEARMIARVPTLNPSEHLKGDGTRS